MAPQSNPSFKFLVIAGLHPDEHLAALKKAGVKFEYEAVGSAAIPVGLYFNRAQLPDVLRVLGKDPERIEISASEILPEIGAIEEKPKETLLDRLSRLGGGEAAPPSAGEAVAEMDYQHLSAEEYHRLLHSASWLFLPVASAALTAERLGKHGMPSLRMFTQRPESLEGVAFPADAVARIKNVLHLDGEPVRVALTNYKQVALVRFEVSGVPRLLDDPLPVAPVPVDLGRAELGEEVRERRKTSRTAEPAGPTPMPGTDGFPLPQLPPVEGITH